MPADQDDISSVRGSNLFDTAFYLQRYQDIPRDCDALEHFMDRGWRQLRDPNWDFNTRFYLTNEGVAASGRNPLNHYLETGQRLGYSINDYAYQFEEVRRSGLFDSAYYKATYADVAAEDVDPVRHFVLYGWFEYRNPSADFDVRAYLQEHPNLLITGPNPISHLLANIALLPGLSAAISPKTMTKSTPIPPSVAINYPLSNRFMDGLIWYDRETPEITIVILSYKRADLVENLIRSIWLNSQGYKYEIICVDNGSPAGEFELRREYYQRVTVIHLTHNTYIGDAYNIGAEKAAGKILVLMNDDIVVEPNWLGPLVAPLLQDEQIGAAGPKFLYPDGQLQEAGALINKDGYALQRGKRGDPDASEFNKQEEVDYCTGATLALRRDDFLSLLGYDWRWSPGYYEEVDLCFKLKSIGKKIIYVPDSNVFHIESVTMSASPPSGNLGLAVQVNRVAFVAKWMVPADNRPQNSPQRRKDILDRISYARSSKQSTRPSLGIFFPYEFVPGGGEKFALSIAREFEKDFDIVFVFEHSHSILRLISVLEDMGFKDLLFRTVSLNIVQAKKPFDIFILIGNELFPIRPAMGKKSYFICQFPFPVPHEFLSQYHNIQYFKDYEAYLVYSCYVKKHVEDRLHTWRAHGVKIHVLPPTADRICNKNEKKALNIIGVGRFFTGGHNKRHDKMIEALRLVLERAPDLKVNLILAGAVHKEQKHREHLASLRALADGLPVEFHVDINREALNDLYCRSRVYLHCAGWDVDTQSHPEMVEHFGISIIEAMSAGCVPVAYAIGGPLEIVHHGVNGVTVNSVSDMADWIIRILIEWDQSPVTEWREHAQKTYESFGHGPFSRRVHELISPPGNPKES